MSTDVVTQADLTMAVVANKIPNKSGDLVYDIEDWLFQQWGMRADVSSTSISSPGGSRGAYRVLTFEATILIDWQEI